MAGRTPFGVVSSIYLASKQNLVIDIISLRAITTIWLLFFASCIAGQDLHFSQFDFSPQNINPALTGIFKGDMRFAAHYRSQWSTVPVPYLTFSGAGDFKIYDKDLESTLFAGGVLFNYDQAGDGRLSHAQLGLSTSVTQQLTERQLLTLGIQFNAIQRTLLPSSLTFGNQFDGEQFNPALPTGEDFGSGIANYSSFSIGMNWHYQTPQSRTRIDGGLALNHFNEPSVSFSGDQRSLLGSRLAVYAKGIIPVSATVDVVAKVLAQRQGENAETLGGAAVLVHLTETVGRELSLQIGGGYRFDDAFIPEVHVFYGPWVIGLSYDVNTSAFSVATRSAGGFELSALYLFTKVRPVPLKICPVF